MSLPRVADYELVDELGGEGIGVVHRARHAETGAPAAVKLMPARLGADDEAVARFVEVARRTSALGHPNLWAVLDVGTTDVGQVYVVMELYEGESIKKKLDRGRLPVAEAVGYAIQAARGLAAAHDAGFLHLDVKPPNLMVTVGGVIKIVDFGLADLAAGREVTRTGTTIGTPEYMSPEQAIEDPVDERSDLWSLGVTLYEMLTGEKPFHGRPGPMVVFSILEEQPTPVEELRPELPPELTAILAKLLSKDRTARHMSAVALESELELVRARFGEPEGGLAASADPQAGGCLGMVVAALAVAAALAAHGALGY